MAEHTADVVVAIPCYNERENLPRLLPQVLNASERVRVIVIDDNSPDDTGEIADDFAEENPRVEVIHRQGKQGLGTAYRDAMKRAAKIDCRLFITMDADFSHHPSYLPKMIQKARDYDVVIGSRYVLGGGTREWGLGRRFISWLAGLSVRLVLGLMPVKDPMGGFRCYNMDIIREFGPDSIISTGFAFQGEMLYRFCCAGATMTEVPIIFENRSAGQSKIGAGEAAGLLRTLIKLRLKGCGHGR
jgi:dolichol-phosphate mannosyltransferase